MIVFRIQNSLGEVIEYFHYLKNSAICHWNLDFNNGHDLNIGAIQNHGKKIKESNGSLSQ